MFHLEDHLACVSPSQQILFIPRRFPLWDGPGTQKKMVATSGDPMEEIPLEEIMYSERVLPNVFASCWTGNWIVGLSLKEEIEGELFKHVLHILDVEKHLHFVKEIEFFSMKTKQIAWVFNPQLLI